MKKQLVIQLCKSRMYGVAYMGVPRGSRSIFAKTRSASEGSGMESVARSRKYDLIMSGRKRETSRREKGRGDRELL
jgi:hypothetical protein